MFRRNFFASLGVLPFGFLMKKPEKETYVVCGDEKYYFINGYVYKKELKDRTKYYNEKGELHREDGPAVECSNGDKWWYKDGLLHRLDGPAIIYSNDNKYWFVEGRRHRLNGPAIEHACGVHEYWIDGKYIKNECKNV